jgi:translation initiation factor IF-1
MMSERISFISSIYLIPGFLLIMLSCGRKNGDSGEATIVRTPVTVTTVSFHPVSEFIDLPAVSQYLNKNIIRATTSGIIEKILIRQGDRVSAGQLLFTIRTREAIAARSLQEHDSSLVFSGLINITSHEAGVINSISYQLGDFVQEGDALAVMSDQGSMVFLLDIPFEYRSVATPNSRCSIMLPDSTEMEGRISGRLPDMNVGSQTISYIITPAVATELPAGLIVKVRLVKSERENVQVVDRKVILSNETQSSFWVMKLINDSTAIRINISKGTENGEETEIIEPLFSKSERLILDGNYGLPDTAFVTIIGDN